VKEVVHTEENFKKFQTDVTGRYILKNSLLAFIKPRLLLYRKEENEKVEGELCLLGFRKKLRLAKHKEQEWIFQCNVDIVTVDVVLRFSTEEAFEGFVDTPVGHMKFTGKKVIQS
jgi:hypothetical protein